MAVADLDEVARAYERDGFVNAGMAVKPHELAALLADLEPFTTGLDQKIDPIGLFPGYAGDISRAPGLNHYQITTLWKVSEPFRKLVHNEHILDVGARLARSNVLQLWADIVQYKPPHSGASFQWHQDAPYHRERLDPPELVLAAWVALDDADEENGCMWMVPGSHRWGIQEAHLLAHQRLQESDDLAAVRPPERPMGTGEWRGAVPCKVRAGEVHFHHALTWHGSHGNRSPRARRAYTINYLPSGVRAIRTDSRMRVEPGALVVEAGPEFPVVYRAIG